MIQFLPLLNSHYSAHIYRDCKVETVHFFILWVSLFFNWCVCIICAQKVYSVDTVLRYQQYSFKCFFNLPLKHECKVCIADIFCIELPKRKYYQIILSFFSFVSSSHHLVFALCRVLSDIHSSRSSPFHAAENIQIGKYKLQKHTKAKMQKYRTTLCSMTPALPSPLSCWVVA